jgi:hypothetical protein
MKPSLDLIRSQKAQGRIVRRSTILDGTVPVLFAPNVDGYGGWIPALEWPPTLEEWNRGPGYIQTPPPEDKDWPKAGSLLRLPQIVWLADGMLWGDVDWSQDIDDQHQADAHHYMDAYQDAMVAIRALRAGRTFVVKPPGIANVKTATGVVNKYFVGFPGCDFDWPLWGPPAEVMDDILCLPMVVIYVCNDFTTPNVMDKVVQIVNRYDTRRWLSRFPVFRCYPVPFRANMPLHMVSFDPADRGKMLEPLRWRSHDNLPAFFDWAGQFPEFYRTDLTSSEQITKDWIVRTVADAFGFDPQTGEDLHPG